MNKKRIKALMALNGDTGLTIAMALSISPQTFSAKLNDRAEFTQNEIRIMKERWRLSADDVDDIFFASKESCKDALSTAQG